MQIRLFKPALFRTETDYSGNFERRRCVKSTNLVKLQLTVRGASSAAMQHVPMQVFRAFRNLEPLEGRCVIMSFMSALRLSPQLI